MIEDDFDVSFIARLALQEKQIQQNYWPLIAVHKWFARRPGTLFRGRHSIGTCKPWPKLDISLRTMLGFTPPEWAYVASERSGRSVTQGNVRTLDRNIRLRPEKPIRLTANVTALIETACDLLSEGAKDGGSLVIHRLDKADTRSGIESLAAVSNLGVPYAMLLYERRTNSAKTSVT